MVTPTRMTTPIKMGKKRTPSRGQSRGLSRGEGGYGSRPGSTQSRSVSTPPNLPSLSETKERTRLDDIHDEVRLSRQSSRSGRKMSTSQRSTGTPHYMPFEGYPLSPARRLSMNILNFHKTVHKKESVGFMLKRLATKEGHNTKGQYAYGKFSIYGGQIGPSKGSATLPYGSNRGHNNWDLFGNQGIMNSNMGTNFSRATSNSWSLRQSDFSLAGTMTHTLH